MMIIVAIGIIIIAIVLLGTFVAYNTQRDEISQKQEVSTIIQNNRVKEDLDFSINMTARNEQVKVENQWGEKTEITGLLVKCENGKTFTRSFTDEIHPSNKIANITITDIKDIKAKCNGG